MKIPEVPEALVEQFLPDPEALYWKASVGPERFAVALMRGSVVVGEAEQPADKDKVNEIIRGLMSEISEWVAFGSKVHHDLGIQVRLDPIKKENNDRPNGGY